jgi:transposase-like protein
MRVPASEKLEIISLVEQSHLPARRTLQTLGIGPSTFYRWYDRFQSGGPEALEDKPSIPKQVWNRIPDRVRERIVTMALELPELRVAASRAASAIPASPLSTVEILDSMCRRRVATKGAMAAAASPSPKGQVNLRISSIERSRLAISTMNSETPNSATAILVISEKMPKATSVSAASVRLSRGRVLESFMAR